MVVPMTALATASAVLATASAVLAASIPAFTAGTSATIAPAFLSWRCFGAEAKNT